MAANNPPVIWFMAQDTGNFQPISEHTPHLGINFVENIQCITASPAHVNFSLEELRLNDYAHDKGRLKRKNDSSDFAFSGFGGAGLAAANVQCSPLHQVPAFCIRLLTSRAPRRLGPKILLFRVGQENPQDFAIHEDLIIPISSFVRLAISKDWKEAKERIIHLPDDDASVFELVQNWLYTSEIPLSISKTDAGQYERFVKTYILADKLNISDLKDSIIDAIIILLRSSGRFDARLVNLVYDNTLEKSPLRRLWLDIYASAGSASWLNEELLGDYLHAEFTLELSRYQTNVARGKVWNFAKFQDGEGAWCAYHEHGIGVCYRSSIWL